MCHEVSNNIIYFVGDRTFQVAGQVGLFTLDNRLPLIIIYPITGCSFVLQLLYSLEYLSFKLKQIYDTHEKHNWIFKH